MAYSTPPKRAPWRVQVEFLDGTIIEGVDDDDVVGRWRRLALWAGDDGLTDAEWLDRVLDRARVFYGAGLIGVSGSSTPRQIVDALAAEQCLMVRRR